MIAGPLVERIALRFVQALICVKEQHFPEVHVGLSPGLNRYTRQCSCDLTLPIEEVIPPMERERLDCPPRKLHMIQIKK